MPTLPRIEAIRPQAQPGAQLNERMGYRGGATLRAVSESAQQLRGILEAREKDDLTQAVFAARRQLDDWERKTLYDPESGAKSKLGRDAFGLSQTLATAFEQETSRIMEGMTATQKRAFEQVAESRRQQVVNWADGYENQQREVFHRAEFKADLDAFTDRAAQLAVAPGDTATNEAQAAAEIEIGQTRIVEFLKNRQGMGEAAIGSAVADFTSRAHAQIIKSMIGEGQADRANEYLKRHGKALTAEQRASLQGAMSELDTRQAAETFADDAMARGLTLTQALEEARAKFPATEPAKRAAAVASTTARFREVETIRTKEQNERDEAAAKVVINGGGRRDIKPDEWSALSANGQKFILDYTDARARRAKADADAAAGKPQQEETTEQLRDFFAAVDMAHEDPAGFVKNFERFLPFVSRKREQELVRIRMAISKSDAKEQSMLRAQKTMESLIGKHLVDAGIDLKSTKPKDVAKAVLFRDAAYDAFRRAAEQGPLTEPIIRDIGLGLLRETYEQGTGGMIFSPTMRRMFEQEEGKQYILAPYSEIPEDLRQTIIADLFPNARRNRGAVVLTAQQKAAVELAYTRAKERGMVP